MKATNKLSIGARVRTWDSLVGTLVYAKDGWLGVRTDVDGKVWEYTHAQVEAAS